MNALYEHFLNFSHATLEEQVMTVVSSSIVGLIILAFVLAVIALLLRWSNDRRDATWRRLKDLWEEDVLDILCGDMSQEQLKKKVHRKHELDFVRFLAHYAYRLRGSDLEILSGLAQPYLQHVKNLLKNRDSGVRAWAVNVLSLFGMPEYEEDIVRMLDDSSLLVAMFAANSLLSQKSTYHTAVVLQRLDRFDHWNMVSLVNLLTHMGNDSIPILRRIYLNRSSKTRTRIIAAEVLKSFNDFSVADQAAELLELEKDRELVAATLRLLSQVGHEQHKHVVRKLCDSEDPIIRSNAYKALRTLSTREDLPMLHKAMQDSFPWVAIQAAWTIWELGDLAFLRTMADSAGQSASLARHVLSQNSSTGDMQG